MDPWDDDELDSVATPDLDVDELEVGDGFDGLDDPVDDDEPEEDSLGSLLGRLDVLDAIDDLTQGGAGGLATSVEIVGESLAHGHGGDMLDAFEPVRDLADHIDIFDDLF